MRGNHDGTRTKMLRAGFLRAETTEIVEVDGVRLWMAHVPTDSSDRKPERRLTRPDAPGEWDVALCGHVHELWTVGPAGDVNVGCDRWDLRPIWLPDVLRALADAGLSPGRRPEPGDPQAIIGRR